MSCSLRPALRCGSIAMLALLGCAPSTPTSPQQPQVVATIPPLADWCRVLLASDAEVTCLLRPGRSPHGYEPTPQDAAHVAQASAVVGWGGTVDTWLGGLLTTAGGSARTTWLGDAPADTADHDHAHDDTNPHTWLDPADARLRVAALADALALAGVADAAQIRARATAYDADLAALEARMGRAAQAWAGHGVVALHNAWPHFLDACGLRELGVVHSVAGVPPSPRDAARLTDLLRDALVPVVLIEPQLSPAVAHTLVRETRAHLVELDPMGRPGVPGYDTYLHMMDSNLTALEAVLGPVPRP